MRIAITGASGNLGTALLAELADPSGRHDVTAIARRTPPAVPPYDGAQWASIDVGGQGAVEELTAAFDGVDVVVHLAWQFQPSHRIGQLRATGVQGTSNVLAASAAAGIGHLVHMSSGAVYSGVDDHRAVDETWPRTGVKDSVYSIGKVDAERAIDEWQQTHTGTPPVARIRPGFIGQSGIGAELLRYALPGYVPAGFLRMLPVLPLDRALTIPAVHAHDVAVAITQIIDQRAHGAFNLAADPPVTAADIADALGARLCHVPKSVVAGAVALSWRLHVQPVDRGWIELAYQVPLLDCSRARQELNWAPRFSGIETIQQSVDAVLKAEEGVSPPLRRRDLVDEVRSFLTGRSVATRTKA
jgi:nucleoside-diphosphate-sugar epimerase